MGFFTLDLARLVGPGGRVIAVDVQPRMLDALRRRATRAGLLERIDCRVGAGGSMGIGDLAGAVDFVLAFAVVHELPDAPAFFAEAVRALKPDGRLLLAEPRGHVDRDAFELTLASAAAVGLHEVGRPGIRSSRAALLASARRG
jgi:SAM-dependent methyltransferase